jgi:DNA-binding CsgD family transcriptional regulator
VTEMILDIADKATRSTMRRGSRWWPEDWEDANGSAVLGVIEAIRSGKTHPGTLFMAARYSIYDWMRNHVGNRDRHSSLEEWREELAQADTAISRSILKNIDALVPLLKRQRCHSSRIREHKISEEVQFLRLSAQGYSIDGIAVELGISRRNTYAIRERLLPRLQMIAAQRTPEQKVVSVKKSSMEALGRINSDPEALKRRGEAIRLAKRKGRVNVA